MALVVGAGLSSLPNKARLPTNVPGPYFVDNSCISCDTCRWMAPKTFGCAHGKSFVAAQPAAAAERQLAAAAAVACPTGSIRSEVPAPEARAAAASFPACVHESIPNVFHLGYHSPKSFGATPYLLAGEQLTVMVDSPRFSTKLAKAIERQFGPPDLLLLTHIDDVADHERWHERWPAMVRVIHQEEVQGTNEWPYISTEEVELQLADADAIVTRNSPPRWELAPGLHALHVPGHSLGSLCFLADAALAGGEGVLFTGDHLALNGRLGRLDGFARYGRDIARQSISIGELAREDFLHILPGHGRRVSFHTAEEREAAVRKAAQDFAEDPHGKHAPGPMYITPGPAGVHVR